MAKQNIEVNQPQEAQPSIEVNQPQDSKFKNDEEFYRQKYYPESLEEPGQKQENDTSEKNTYEKPKFGIVDYEENEDEEIEEKLIDSDQSQEAEKEEDREVDFLGEKVKVKKEEEKDLIQMGLNYKRKMQEFEAKEKEYNQYSEKERKILEFTGAKDFTELEQIIEQQKVQEEAQKYVNQGYDEEVAQKIAQNEAMQRRQQQELEQLKQQQQIFQVQSQNIQIRNDLSKDAYFDKVSPLADQLIQKSPTLRYDLAYNLAKGQLFDQLIQQNNSNQQASTIANIQSRAKYTNESSSNKNSGIEYDLPNDVDEISAAFGRSSREEKNSIRKYVASKLKRK